MTWFRVDDGFGEHAKVDALGADLPVALSVWLLCGSGSARARTDGKITSAALGRHCALMRDRDRIRGAAALVRVGLWDVSGDGDGWIFHQWDEHQPLRVDLERAAELGKRRKDAWKERKRAERAERSASSVEREGNGVPPAFGTRLQGVTGTHAPTRPDPTRPDPTRPDPIESESARALGRDTDPMPLPGHSVPWKPLVEPLRAAILTWAKTRKVAPPREALLGSEGLALVPVAKWIHETGEAQGWDAAERERRCAWLVERFYAAKGSTAEAGYPLAFLARNPQQYALDTQPRGRA